MRKWVVTGAIVLVLVVAAGFLLRTNIHASVRERLQRGLATHFASTVEFSDFDVTMFPRMHITITGLVLRHKGRTDIPPLIQVSKVSMYATLHSVLRRNPEITFVKVDGLRISTPPRTPGGKPLIQGTDQDLAQKYPVLVDE